MYLINIQTKQLEAFVEDHIPPYAILSHTWGADQEEITFQEVRDGFDTKFGTGRSKFDGCCAQARKDGLSYVWIDTCCIDKSSAVELSEAINSMFRWYKESTVCYVYLSDVSSGGESPQLQVSFRGSRWFTRGWTLQELIAPRTVQFYDAEWNPLGTKQQLSTELVAITGIPRIFLLNNADMQDASVAQRMSWAANRVTKRKEDMAYCLLGIFNISMTMIYGEGDRAFVRLQEEILRHIPDDTILAWGPSRTKESIGSSSQLSQGSLASSPADFWDSGQIIPSESVDVFPEPIRISGGSLQVQRRLHTDQNGQHFLVINSERITEEGKIVGVPIQLETSYGQHRQYRRLHNAPLISLARDSLNAAMDSIQLRVNTMQISTKLERKYSLYVENSPQKSLKLIEVVPHSCWSQDTNEIVPLTDKNGEPQRIWARFRHGQSGSFDTIVALDLGWPRTHHRVMVCSRGNVLSAIAEDFDKLGVSLLENHSAYNGVINTRFYVTSEAQRWHKAFNLNFESSDEITDTLDISNELTQLGLYQTLANQLVRSHELSVEATELRRKLSMKVTEVKSIPTPTEYSEEEIPSRACITQAFPRRSDYLKGRLSKISREEREIQDDTAKTQSLLKALRDEQTPEAREAENWPARIVQHLLEVFLPVEEEIIDLMTEDVPQLAMVATRFDNQLLFDYLLTLGLDTKTVNQKGGTLLMYAATAGAKSIFHKLLVADVDKKSRNEACCSALKASWDVTTFEKNWPGIELLLAEGADVESKNNKGTSILALAAYYGHEKATQLLLDLKANIESKNDVNYSPLALAAYGGYEQTAQLLLDHGADIESKNDNGYSPLALAASNGHEKVIQLLLARKANIESKTNNGYSALALAASNGHEQAVQLLLTQKADMESKNKNGYSPLALAAINGHEKAIQLLLEQGADIEFKDPQGFSSLALAVYYGHETSIQLLLDKGADIESTVNNGNILLIQAIYRGNEKVIQLLLDHGANIESQDPKGFSPLSLAVSQGHEKIIQLLLRRGANIDSKNKSGYSPIAIAAFNGNEKAIRTLLDHGADIESTNNEGITPLGLAAFYGHKATTQLLLKNGAKIANVYQTKALDYLASVKASSIVNE